MPAGGGGLGALWNTTRIQKNISDINFTGAGVSVYQVGKGIRVDIPGAAGAVTKIKAGTGIDITSTGADGTGEVTVINHISVKGAQGALQFANNTGQDLQSGYLLYNYNAPTALEQSLDIPSVLKIGTQVGDAYIQYPDGTTQGTAPNKFYYQTNSPSGVVPGDRWMDSDNGIEYVYINDGNTNQWVQPTNTGGSSTTSISILATTAVTGSTYAALASDYYIGVSYAGPVTITLPTNPETGREIVVKDESGNAGSGVSRQITIVGATAAHKIDNQSSAIINLDNAGLHFIYRSGWRII